MKVTMKRTTPDLKHGFTVSGIMKNDIKIIPAKSDLSLSDYLGMIRVRLGIGRNDYAVAPGLYAVGSPDAHSPVFVTANYRYTFDLVRRDLKGISAYLLVLDTKGINVWCAAGKGTFGSHELVKRIKVTRLAHVVTHSTVIVPQLGAVGVAAHEVKKGSGFTVKFGPVYSKDIASYLADGCTKSSKMREVHFNLIDRLLVVPVEISLSLKYIAIALAISAVLSYFSPVPGSFMANAALVIGAITAGTVVVPLLLPYIPFKAFSLKGVLAGAAAGYLVAWHFNLTGLDFAGTMMLSCAISSFTAMNFTGATTFTNLVGVKKEIAFSLPFIVLLLAGGLAAKILYSIK